MAEKRRFLDVWIIDSNTIYREVPFTVVTDWVQQSRLLADDMLRPSGTAEWFKVGSSPEFAPYLPRAEPFQAEDQAEALAPVDLGFSWKRSQEGGEEDVDMIPLIDVSLVLLIFFMLTATGVGAGLGIPTPDTVQGQVASSGPSTVEVGIRLRGDDPNAPPVYSLRVAGSEQEPGIQTLPELLDRLRALLDKTNERVELTIHADRRLKAGVVRDLNVALEQQPFRSKIAERYIGVQDRVP